MYVNLELVISGHRVCWCLACAEQQVSTDAETQRDEITDELGPTSTAGVARRVRSQGRGCDDHSEIFQTGRTQD